MKFLKILLICLLLSACSSNSGDLNTNLEAIFSDSSAGSSRLNNYSDYIDYYLPSDLVEYSADKLSFVFCLNDDKLIMNVNIDGIIDSQYYEQFSLTDDGFFDENKLFYSKSAYFLDHDNNETNYFVNIYKYDDIYLIHFVDHFINIYAYCEYDEVELMAKKVYALGKSAEVDTQAVLANYSSRDVIEYHKSTVDLFEKVMPVEGRIDDMMIDEESQVSDN